MAKLMKLHISGIRSFGPHEEHSQQLKFASPVTLILGQNGCGKTTIIESIKYACSGDVPGGTYFGQGFVSDPKMSMASVTQGQIKLKFMDSIGNEITVSRVAELTQTHNTTKLKKKTSTIRKLTPAGKVTTINGLCGDITNKCCQLMNISASVLNNVIFCHQDNSLWPLDLEGKKLKEKFDEIFDVQNYNNCTELLRNYLKIKKNKLKVLEAQLRHKEDKKEYVEKQTRMLQDRENKLQGFEDDIRTKNEQLVSVIKQLNVISEFEQIFGYLETQLTTKQATKKGVVEEQSTIKRNLSFEFEGDDEELRNKIDSFAEDRQREETLIAYLDARKTVVENKDKEMSIAIEEAQTQLGNLNQQKNQYEKKCEERKDLIEEAKNVMEVTDLPNQFSDNAAARAVLCELKMELEHKDMCLSVLIEEKEQEEGILQVSIDASREKTVSARQNKLSKETEMKQCEKKIDGLSNELIVLSTSDIYSKKIESIDYNLNKTFQETEESENLDTFRKNIQAMETTLAKKEGEYRILQQNDILEGKIESEKHLVLEKQKEIDRVRAKCSDGLRQLFGETIPERNLKELWRTKQGNADAIVKHLTDSITKKQKEVTTFEVQHQNQQEKIATCEKELKMKQEKISQACNGRDFNETLDSSFQKKEHLQIDKALYISLQIIYGQFIKKFEEESPCCPVCETNFSNKNGVVQKIITTLKSKLDRVPQELAKIENELEKEEALYNKLQQLKLANLESQVLANEKLPQLKQRLGEIERQLTNNWTELNELKTKLNEPLNIVQISKNFISDVASLDQNLSDVNKSLQTLENLKKGLVQVASNESKQEVEAEIHYLKSQLSELREKVEKINNHRDRVQQLLQEKATLVENQMRLKENLQSRPVLEAQKTELTEKVAILKEEISTLQSQLFVLEGELKHAIENRKCVVQRNKKVIQEERDRIAFDSKILQEIEKLQKEIDDYLSEGIEAKLKATESELQERKNKEKVFEEAKTEILNAISAKKEALAREELRYRTLQNNMVLREKKNLEEKLESEIQELKRRIGDYNNRTVREDKVRLEAQREELQRQIDNLQGEKTGLLQSLEEIRTELSNEENKNAYANYMAQYYQLTIAQLAIDDMYKYIVALEKAVLEIHKSKMVQINRSIRDLWRNTYRGNDIDYIEIKTEFSSGSTTKRSYNYKVVQIKNGIELDMRGRCSAGQRVLACLIIRMALAETLSANCGILALDEPTTNLDRNNINSLCDTLTRIIRTRYKEKNFQLLIITHDEEFLTALTRTQGLSFYYRVDRDSDGYSVIKKEYTIQGVSKVADKLFRT